ncbi:hypothetical protein GCM10022204_45700 [Microlunatus aurantiacus]|uniref:Uncharacterized protein n=2 Tax=Microlunatus aurantiacus TaxID=446786 RepID=A0ABP7EMI8_9ACTN
MSAKSVLGEDFAVRFGSIISAGSAAAALSESMKASTAFGPSAKSVLGENFAARMAAERKLLVADYVARYPGMDAEPLESASGRARTDGGVVLPTPSEILLFGSIRIDRDRMYVALVLSGLLLPAIMSSALAPYREWASWALWLVPAIYAALGAKKIDR